MDRGTLRPRGTVPAVSASASTRTRLRQLGFAIGTLETGRENAITDVPGVLVGHSTLIRDEPEVVRTGITMVVPRADVWTDYVYAGSHVLNGDGEMTGLIWVAESGMLGSPIGITSTSQVGLVRDFLVAETHRLGVVGGFHLPVVGETWDGWLSTPGSFPLTADHASAALAAAAPGPVVEGSVGGGTGMICHEFKGGIGTSSRVGVAAGVPFTVGVLVQANYGGGRTCASMAPLSSRNHCRRGSVALARAASGWVDHHRPSRRRLDHHRHRYRCAASAHPVPSPRERATVGLRPVGGYGHESSGDIFLAFSTANHLGGDRETPLEVRTLPLDSMDPVFHAAADATEEAIVDALCATQTMTGRAGHTAPALPLDLLVEVMGRYGRLPAT